MIRIIDIRFSYPDTEGREIINQPPADIQEIYIYHLFVKDM